MPHLAISQLDTFQFIDYDDDPPPSLEPRRVALVEESLGSHRGANSGVGSIELSHLFGSAPDVDVFHDYTRP
jgi:hypothetical protein